jgi:hypothetical protein
MAFLSDELENLYKELKDGGSKTEINKKFGIFIAHKFEEVPIKNTRDMVDNVIYVNGIVNRSSFVTKGVLSRNVVIRFTIDCLPEEMAMKPYNYYQTLKEKLEELEIEEI